MFSDAAAIAVIAGVCLILFRKSLGLYFIQDDFTYLWSTSDHSLSGFLHVFATRTAGFYRPISNNLYFFLFQALFGTNPFPYHLANLLIHIINSLAVGYMVLLLTENRKLAFAASLIFASRVGHVIAVYWICVTTQSMTLMFFLLSFILYLQYQKKGNRTCLLLSYFSFALCAFSNISGPTLVVLVTAYDFLMRRDVSIKKIVGQEAPFYAVILLFVIIQFFVFGYDAHGEYQAAVNLQALKNFGALNIFLYNALFLLDDYLQYPLAMLVVGAIVGGLTIAGLLFFCVRHEGRSRSPESRLLVFFGFFYFWGFLPYLSLSKHLWLGEYIWPQYMTVSAVGLAFLLGWALTRFLPGKAFVVTICIVSLVAFLAVRAFERLEYDTHGTLYKSEVARNVISDITRYLESRPNSKRIVIVDADVQVWWILHYGRNLEVFTGKYRPILYVNNPSKLPRDKDSLVLKYSEMHLYKFE